VGELSAILSTGEKKMAVWLKQKSTCFASTKHRVQTPVPPIKKERKKGVCWCENVLCFPNSLFKINSFMSGDVHLERNNLTSN
jgi:hypothetical protein